MDWSSPIRPHNPDSGLEKHKNIQERGLLRFLSSVSYPIRASVFIPRIATGILAPGRGRSGSCLSRRGPHQVSKKARKQHTEGAFQRRVRRSLALPPASASHRTENGRTRVPPGRPRARIDDLPRFVWSLDSNDPQRSKRRGIALRRLRGPGRDDSISLVAERTASERIAVRPDDESNYRGGNVAISSYHGLLTSDSDSPFTPSIRCTHVHRRHSAGQCRWLTGSLLMSKQDLASLPSDQDESFPSRRMPERGTPRNRGRGGTEIPPGVTSV